MLSVVICVTLKLEMPVKFQVEMTAMLLDDELVGELVGEAIVCEQLTRVEKRPARVLDSQAQPQISAVVEVEVELDAEDAERAMFGCNSTEGDTMYG